MDLINEIIPVEIEDSLSLMLQSNDEEIFNLAWERLWQFNFELNGNIVYNILLNANPNFLKNKGLDSPYYKLWIAKYPFDYLKVVLNVLKIDLNFITPPNLKKIR